MYRRGLLLIAAALAVAGCAQAEADTYPVAAPIEPLPPVATTNASITTTSQPPAPTTSTTTTTTTTLPPTNGLELVKEETIGGDISPKSVVATGNGLFFAQNMMYRHTVTVYNRDYELLATISDEVDLSEFGLGEAGSTLQGAPVEAVPTRDGSYVYVSNYQMYGPGYSRAGGDGCNQGGWDESFVYRISTESLQIDQVIPAGAVPKFLAITPDDSLVLTTNWCGFDLSVIDTSRGEEIARVPLGRHPRGIAVTSDGATAYVAVMGSTDIAIVDLDSFEVGWIRGVGANPRHLIIDSADRYLYATLNGEGTVVRIDLDTGMVIDRIRTGSAPRSMTISDDDLSLYVVNYESDTVSKIDTLTMEVLQNLPVAHHPIGITFDSESRQVWVASYSGVITVFAEVATSH